jgi:uncharacterized phage protein gp47/JayE
MAQNLLSASGLQIQTQPDIVATLTVGYTSIYGADISLQPNTPDGQMMNIFSTALEDNLELLQSVYNMFNLINAYGVQLDNIAQLLGIQRQAGSYTQAQVTITVSQALTLPGQDVLIANPGATVFTVADQAGNQFQLVTSYTFGSAGTQTLTFAAVDIGQILTSPDTITAILTPLLGVTSVNNPSTANDVIGTIEESDSSFRVRMAQSFQIAATGPADSMRAQLMNLPGILDAFVAENDTGGIIDGVPANGIWVIVNNATATPAQIAQIIYAKKGMGCAQKTSSGQSYNITRSAGNVFTSYWDNAVGEAIYISFTILPINGVDSFNPTTLATSLAEALVYKLNGSAFVGQIISAMQIIAPNGYLTSVFVGISTSQALQVVSPSDFQHYFQVIPGNILISVEK